MKVDYSQITERNVSKVYEIICEKVVSKLLFSISYYLQDNVDEFMSQPENSGGVDVVLRRLDEQHGKYKFMEYTLTTKRRRLRQQIPDLARSLEMIEKMKSQKEDREIQFLLSDQVFVKVGRTHHIIFDKKL